MKMSTPKHKSSYQKRKAKRGGEGNVFKVTETGFVFKKSDID
jgi:hypothetical protein